MQLIRADARRVFFRGPNGFSHDKSKSRPRQRGEKSSPNLLVRHLAAPTRRLRRGEGPGFLTGCFGPGPPGLKVTTFSFCRRSDRLSKGALSVLLVGCAQIALAGFLRDNRYHLQVRNDRYRLMIIKFLQSVDPEKEQVGSQDPSAISEESSATAAEFIDAISTADSNHVVAAYLT